MSTNTIKTLPFKTVELRTYPAVYEDPTWKVEVKTFTDKSSYLSMHSSNSQEVIEHPSLEDLTEKVRQSRPEPNLSKDDPLIQARNITHSATPRKDLQASVHLSKAQAEALGVNSLTPEELRVQHVFLKNGLNNRSYIAADGTKVVLKTAIAGSSDRETDKLQMARKVAPLSEGIDAKKAPSYCYTGRPDTEKRALEQATMIFFSELDSNNPKGLKKKSETSFELTYVVNSLQSNSPLYGAARLVGGKSRAPEHLMFEQEEAALKTLSEGVYSLKRNGKTYVVKFKPILFSRQINIFSNLEKVLDSSISGSKRGLEASRKGWEKLKEIAEPKAQGNPLIRYLIDRIDRSMNGRWIGSQEEALDELFCRAVLVKLLNLPIVYHCKSSTDRTSIFVAMQVALEQWLAIGKKIPENPTDLLDDENFKELFAMNWMQGHQISRNARSAEGLFTINGKTEEIDGEYMTLFIGNGIDSCSPLVRLLPERYLTSYGVKGFIFQDGLKGFLKNSAIWAALVLMSLLTLPFTTLLNPHGTLKTPENFAASILLGILRYPFMLIKNYFAVTLGFYRAIPKKKIDANSPLVGPRHLIKETKTYQKRFLEPMKAIPANARSQEEYDQLFNQRFNQSDRPLRHEIQGNADGINTLPAHNYLSRILNLPALGKTVTTQRNLCPDTENSYTCIHTLPNYATLESTTTLNPDGTGTIEFTLIALEKNL
jgi:hypothetical protein